MTTPMDLRFTAPTLPVSQNQANGMHWAKLRGHLEPWKDAAWVTAQNARRRAARTPQGGPVEPITIQVTIPFRAGRRRDPHNYTGTVVKAVVDGIVRAGIVPDDTPDWVTVLDPILVVQNDSAPLTATVHIRPRKD